MNTDISELDFSSYKNKLKTYLKRQTQFKDYDFDGANISVLLDVLAYNTYQNAFYRNMIASEMFLDSSQLYNSVLSHAKTLGYLPRSTVSASLKANIELTVDEVIPFVLIPRKTRFLSSPYKGVVYTFNTDKTYILERNTDGRYLACIDIFEGKYVEEKFVADTNKNKVYPISNENVDIRSLKVYVLDVTTNVETEYLYRSDLFGISNTDFVFYLQCTDSKYEIVFGQNVFGVSPNPNSIIRVEYRISNGASANGIKNISRTGPILNNSISSIEELSAAFGGAEKETIESIKFYAPKSLQIQDRAVTENDFSVLLKNTFPEIQAVSVLGGEKMNPPQYGRVIIYVDLIGSNGIAEAQKSKFISFLKQRTPLSIDPIILSPEFTFVEVKTTVTCDPRINGKTFAELSQLIKTSILNYGTKYLNDFNKTARLSNITSIIDSSDKCILSNVTTIRAIKEVYVEPNVEFSIDLNFNGPMQPIADFAFRTLQSTVPSHPVIPRLSSESADRLPTLSSSSFVYKGARAIIRDDGFGKLQIIKVTPTSDIILNRNVGKINYETGAVSIQKFQVDSLAGSALSIYGNMKLSDIEATKSSIISIRAKDLSITIKDKD